MSAINFPDSPSNGDSHTVGNQTWIYNSAINAWEGLPATVTAANVAAVLPAAIAEDPEAVRDAAGLVTPYEAFGTECLSSLRSALELGVSSSIAIIGDSTGNEDSEWVRLLAGKLAAKYPTARVIHKLWNDGTANWTDTVVQAANGEPFYNFASATSCGACNKPTPIPTDIDIRFKIESSDFTTQAGIIGGKSGASGNFGFYVRITNNKRLQLYWSENGTAQKLADFQGDLSGYALPYAVNTPFWIRCTLDTDNGAGGYTADCYHSADGITWTKFNSTITGAGTTSIFATTESWSCGGYSGAVGFKGKVFRVEVRDAINGGQILPLPIDTFTRFSENIQVGGSPELVILNSSISGITINGYETWINWPKYLLDYGTHVAFVSLGHNEFHSFDDTWWARYEFSVAKLKAGFKKAGIIMLPQNKRIGPSDWQAGQARRRVEKAVRSAKAGLGFIDTYGELSETSDMNADGYHPSPQGSEKWAQLIYRHITD